MNQQKQPQFATYHEWAGGQTFTYPIHFEKNAEVHIERAGGDPDNIATSIHKHDHPDRGPEFVIVASAPMDDKKPAPEMPETGSQPNEG